MSTTAPARDTEIEAQSGSHFDPALVAAFRKLDHPDGDRPSDELAEWQVAPDALSRDRAG